MISTLAVYNYRSLRLLADIAQGRIIPSLAREGGLQSTLWAGPEGFSREMKEGGQPVQGTLRKGRSACGWASPARSSVMPSRPAAALGRLIGRAAERSQVLVVSHASRLIAALEEQPGCQSLTLGKGLGETTLAGAGRFDKPRWEWPKR